MARIDRKLNIVIPIDQASGGTIYVHSTPISREVFEQYFLPISQAFTGILKAGLDVLAGPRVAMLMLKRVAVQSGEWEGPGGVEQGLVAEIRRLTNVVIANGQGWKTLPYHDAVQHKMIDAEDISEVENALAFFTLVSSIERKETLQNELVGMNLLWGVQNTSSSLSEFMSSLPTLIEAVSSGGTETTSSETS